ncbi:histidine kinase [Aliterella atlantica]
MLKQDCMQVSQPPTHSEAPLQLLLFVDDRPSSRQQIQQIRAFLKQLRHDYAFELQIVDVGEQPYLAEQFRLVATPALIKIHPQPQQVLAGSDLETQLKNWWLRWQQSVENYLKLTALPENVAVLLPPTPIRSIADSAELLKLSDEVFRLKREKEKLIEQLQFKDRAIAMLVHDLRNPLTAVSIALETLETNLLPQENRPARLKPELAAQLFKQARSQARSINRMITGLLQVASGTSSELHIEPTKLDMIGLCQEIMAHLGDRLQAKNQTLETDLPCDLPCVYADIERLRQVLINLLENAIKYTPASGTIRISALHRTSQKVQVSICDTGPGIPVENRDRVFEERYRLQRDRALEGYGIGLALCQRIIRAHYGQIWVDSGLSCGSCFHFTIPVYPV